MLGGNIVSAQVNAFVHIKSTKYDDNVNEELVRQIELHRMKCTFVCG